MFSYELSDLGISVYGTENTFAPASGVKFCLCCSLPNASRLMAFVIRAIFRSFCNCFVWKYTLPTSHVVAYCCTQQVCCFYLSKFHCTRLLHLNDVVLALDLLAWDIDDIFLVDCNLLHTPFYNHEMESCFPTQTHNDTQRTNETYELIN